jgi:hypothetical protein
MSELNQPALDSLALKKVQHAAGLACLAAVVVIWVTSSEVIQYIFDNIDFSKPFFLTFYSTSLFSLYLFGFLLFPSWRANPRYNVHIICGIAVESAEINVTIVSLMCQYPKTHRLFVGLEQKGILER